MSRITETIKNFISQTPEERRESAAWAILSTPPRELADSSQSERYWLLRALIGRDATGPMRGSELDAFARLGAADPMPPNWLSERLSRAKRRAQKLENDIEAEELKEGWEHADEAGRARLIATLAAKTATAVYAPLTIHELVIDRDPSAEMAIFKDGKLILREDVLAGHDPRRAFRHACAGLAEAELKAIAHAAVTSDTDSPARHAGLALYELFHPHAWAGGASESNPMRGRLLAESATVAEIILGPPDTPSRRAMPRPGP